MDAFIGVAVHDSKHSSKLPRAVSVDGTGTHVTFSCPPTLRSAGFPVADSTIACQLALSNPSSDNLYKSFRLSDEVSKFLQKRQNLVFFSYGVRSTPRRQLMYGCTGKEKGFATRVMAEICTAGASSNSIFAISCYVLGHTERLVDLINLENEQGTIEESVKKGPHVRGVGRVGVGSAGDVESLMSRITANYEKVFAASLGDDATPEQTVFPPFNGDSIVLQFSRYENTEHFDAFSECNSLSFICLGDAERPILCGVDPGQLSAYEKTQRVLLSAVGIVSSIKCSRLRIPFGKSKLSQLLRRCYNAEKADPYSGINAPTKTVLLLHCFSDGAWTEESYHCLSMIFRVSTMVGSTGIGSVLRDLSVEKWRLDQDIAELKDELLIAKRVYDYKPCIYESGKPIANIEEEEATHIAAIQAKRDEVREKQLTLIRQRAKEEAARMIKEQETKSGTTLAELEKALEAKKKENAGLLKEREDLTHEYEQTLEKMRKKKETEEQNAENLKTEIVSLEEELAQRQRAIQEKQKQLEMAQLDKAKAREAVMHERESVEAVRKTVMDSRRGQREQWIKQINEINDKVREQVRSLAEERRKSGDAVSAKEEKAEKCILDDIAAVKEYLPKLISLEDTPVNLDEIESFRRQFAEVFGKEKAGYLASIEEERGRKEKLERGLEAYRSKVIEAAQERKKESFQTANMKDQQITILTDKVLSYLQSGLRMTKVSSQGNLRRRFYFISDDSQRIHSCELDSRGMAISIQKPPVTVFVQDIKKVVIGTYTSSFVHFADEATLAKSRQEVVTDEGTHRFAPTRAITPSNLGLYNYRSFALLLKGGKSLELVCDSDADCEAWLMVLRRLLHLKTEAEMLTTPSGGVPSVNAREVMGFGGKLDIRNMHGFLSLVPDEAIFCAEEHIPPALYLRIRKEMSDFSQTGIVTVYDIRNEFGLDFIRSRSLYDFLTKQHLISAKV